MVYRIYRVVRIFYYKNNRNNTENYFILYISDRPVQLAIDKIYIIITTME